MPLTIETSSHQPTADIRTLRAQRDARSALSRRIRVGLVNNMPDAALRATERQFASLLEEASGDYDVRLALINLDSVPREAAAREAIAENYRSIASLRLTDFDALIFTGAEPRAPDLRQEPYWRELTELMDWARSHLISNFYSCLAAHVAVLHRDGIERKRLPNKLSGVFACEIIASHPLVDGIGAEFLMPHSRYNDLSQEDLIDKRYLPLAALRKAASPSSSRKAMGSKSSFKVTRNTSLIHWRGSIGAMCCVSFKACRRGRRSRLWDISRQMWRRASLHEWQIQLLGPSMTWLKICAQKPRVPGEASWRASSRRLFGNWLAAIARRKAERMKFCRPDSATGEVMMAPRRSISSSDRWAKSSFSHCLPSAGRTGQKALRVNRRADAQPSRPETRALRNFQASVRRRNCDPEFGFQRQHQLHRRH